jgi:hypothetical protein
MVERNNVIVRKLGHTNCYVAFLLHCRDALQLVSSGLDTEAIRLSASRDLKFLLLYVAHIRSQLQQSTSVPHPFFSPSILGNTNKSISLSQASARSLFEELIHHLAFLAFLYCVHEHLAGSSSGHHCSY